MFKKDAWQATMNRIIALVILAVHTQLACASPNSAISEKQNLYGVTGTSYYVVSVEWEIKTSYLRTYQRTFLKEYSIQDNREISSNLLSSTIRDIDIETQEITISKNAGVTTSIADITESKPITLAGYLKRDSSYSVDRQGVIEGSGLDKRYLLSATQIESRIPDYDLPFKYQYELPVVIGSYLEYISGKERSFVVIRKGQWRSDSSSYEVVFSIPIH